MKYIFLSLLLFSSPVIAVKPNIVFILADDLGYGELGCYGQKKIKTPNIDKLAKEGMLFTQHYAGAPVCGPSRCVLLTGKNLAHAEARDNREVQSEKKKYGGQLPLSKKALTIAEVLKSHGYVTGAFGKWGLGASDSTGSPNKQGFDRFYGYNCQRNAHSYYPAYLDSDEDEVTINERRVSGHRLQKDVPVFAEDYRSKNYAPDLILAEAVKFIGLNKKKSFFLYLPFVEPHVAMQPHQEDVDRYPVEWDDKPYRGQRGYTPHPRPHAGYAAMITDLDSHVGTIMAKLKAEGLDNNTIVIFTSDNGPTHDSGGVDTQFFNSSGGLRGRKGSVYEGGLRVPLIVRWKGVVSPNSKSDIASYFADWFPTLSMIAGAGSELSPTDGIDLTPALKSFPVSPRKEPMFWEFHGYGGQIAIRDGKWKAIRKKLNSKEVQPWELYDVTSDPKETKNLAIQHPKVVSALEKSWLESRTDSANFPLSLKK